MHTGWSWKLLFLSYPYCNIFLQDIFTCKYTVYSHLFYWPAIFWMIISSPVLAKEGSKILKIRRKKSTIFLEHPVLSDRWHYSMTTQNPDGISLCKYYYIHIYIKYIHIKKTEERTKDDRTDVLRMDGWLMDERTKWWTDIRREGSDMLCNLHNILVFQWFERDGVRGGPNLRGLRGSNMGGPGSNQGPSSGAGQGPLLAGSGANRGLAAAGDGTSIRWTTITVISNFHLDLFFKFCISRK